MEIRKAEAILKERYGEEGSETREAFKEQAYAYYFGKILKNRRKELKLTQGKLAEMIGKQRPYISRIENGEDIRISNLFLVANALNLSIRLVPQ